MTSVADAQGRPHLVRLLTWVPGTVLAGVQPHTPELLRSLGSLLGAMDAALAGFSHPAAERDLKWDPRRAGWIREYVGFVDDGARRRLVERLFTWAEGELTRLAPRLRTGVIHNDANDYNVLVRRGDPYARRVTSVVDFGDMLHTWIANEPAVACAYAMLHKPDPLGAAVPDRGGLSCRVSHCRRPRSRRCSPWSAAGWPSASSTPRTSGTTSRTTST